MDYIPTAEEIRAGRTTDVYFVRTLEILRQRGLDRVPVKAEIYLKGLPSNYEWGIFAGVEEVASLLEGRGVRLSALPEGSLFFPGEPVAVIEGAYGEFAEMETALLGILCQASGIATKAARVKEAAGDRIVLSFGARRMHPALSVFIDRYAYIGGCDGVSVILSAEKLGIPPTGTIPHALILVMGDTVEAMRAFDEVVPPEVNRICLIDTFQDEKFEAIRVAEAFGEKLFAVRLDTPSSR
ncbi:MAG: nicotinate phosphoribosyltransferase, partial [Deltaproteobacteria bacterium]